MRSKNKTIKKPIAKEKWWFQRHPWLTTLLFLTIASPLIVGLIAWLLPSIPFFASLLKNTVFILSTIFSAFFLSLGIPVIAVIHSYDKNGKEKLSNSLPKPRMSTRRLLQQEKNLSNVFAWVQDLNEKMVFFARKIKKEVKDILQELSDLQIKVADIETTTELTNLDVNMLGVRTNCLEQGAREVRNNATSSLQTDLEQQRDRARQARGFVETMHAMTQDEIHRVGRSVEALRQTVSLLETSMDEQISTLRTQSVFRPSPRHQFTPAEVQRAVRELSDDIQSRITATTRK